MVIQYIAYKWLNIDKYSFGSHLYIICRYLRMEDIGITCCFYNYSIYNIHLKCLPNIFSGKMQDGKYDWNNAIHFGGSKCGHYINLINLGFLI